MKTMTYCNRLASRRGRRAVREMVGRRIKLDVEDLIMMKESDILGVIDHAAAKQQAA